MYRYAPLACTPWRVIIANIDGAPTLPDPGTPAYERSGAETALARSHTTVSCALHAVAAAKEVVDAWPVVAYLRSMQAALSSSARTRAERLDDCWRACTPGLVAQPTAELLAALAHAAHWDVDSVAWALTRYSIDQDRLAFALQRQSRNHWWLLFEHWGTEVRIEIDDRGLWGLDGLDAMVQLACGRGAMRAELSELLARAQEILGEVRRV